MDLRDAAARYARHNLATASPNTLRLWRIAVDLFSRHLGRSARIADLTDDTLAGFIGWRLESVTAATTNRDVASLLALWRWLHRCGEVTRWPMVRLVPEPRRTPQAWSRRDFCRLMAAARDAPGRVGDWPARDWWPALLLVLYDTGERIGAVLQLAWPQVDLDGRWVLFLAATRKGRREDKLSRIADDTAEVLAAIRGDGLVFRWPKDYGYLWACYGRLLRSSGLPTDRYHKFHCIRRTTASHLEAAGGDATAALGHAARRTTLAYLDPRITQPPQAVDRLWRPK